MHRPTYIFLILCACAFGFINLFGHWQTNRLLFGVGIFVVVITVYGASIQILQEENWELKWMRYYTVPAGLLVVGSVVGYTEMNNEILKSAGIKALPSSLPGTSQDYRDAVTGHYISMAAPLVARLSAAFVGWTISLSQKSFRPPSW